MTYRNCGGQDCGERTSCTRVGEIGHGMCGKCPEHNDARHHCGCFVLPPQLPDDTIRDTLIDCITSFTRSGDQAREIADFILSDQSGLKVSIA